MTKPITNYNFTDYRNTDLLTTDFIIELKIN